MNFNTIPLCLALLMPGALNAMELREEEYNTCVVKKSFYRVRLQMTEQGSTAGEGLEFTEQNGILVSSAYWKPLADQKREITVADIISSASLSITTINRDFVIASYKLRLNEPLSSLIASLTKTSPNGDLRAAIETAKASPKYVQEGSVKLFWGQTHPIAIAGNSENVVIPQVSIEAKHITFGDRD